MTALLRAISVISTTIAPLLILSHAFVKTEAFSTARYGSNNKLAVHGSHVDLSTAVTSRKGTWDLFAAPSGDDEKGDVAAVAAKLPDDLDLTSDEQKLIEQNTKYIEGLLSTLEGLLDKWICTGAMATRRRAFNIIQQVERLAIDGEVGKRAQRLATRAGMPLEEPPPVPPTEHIPAVDQFASRSAKDDDDGPAACGGGVTMETGDDFLSRSSQSDDAPSPRKQGVTIDMTDNDKSIGSNREQFANARLAFEKGRVEDKSEGDPIGTFEKPRSALSARQDSDSVKPDVFMPQVMNGNLDPAAVAEDKAHIEKEMAPAQLLAATLETHRSAARASELVALAGSGSAFEGANLGVGGLDDVLAQIKRRVWVPLAAPPSLLDELGINPVRGLLLYGQPGCGKTLLARKLGSILSPARPISIVSGPSILDKFVGSSEKNLREIFDNPPDLFYQYKKNHPELKDRALHVIVLDEFDAIARARGGSGGKGDQGDAGVARDSVVNQLLAKMDGVHGLGVPTLLIGLTNKRTLIDPALLRPGRFEVQIEVPAPKTVAQRVSILEVHMGNMFKSGRILVRDAPDGTAAWRKLQSDGGDGVLSFDELLDLLGVECDGMSGASLAGVCRAAASRALERSVTDFAGSTPSSDNSGESIADCLVTQADLELAVEDVFDSARSGDGDY